MSRQLKSRKKWPKDTQDKNAIENLGVLTSNAAIITFRECIWVIVLACEDGSDGGFWVTFLLAKLELD